MMFLITFTIGSFIWAFINDDEFMAGVGIGGLMGIAALAFFL